MAASRLARSGPLRRAAVGLLDRELDRRLARRTQRPSLLSDPQCDALSWERTMMAKAVLHTWDRAVEQSLISPHVLRVASRLWTRALVDADSGRRPTDFERANGVGPPWFLVVSPGRGCNLNCSGCYAGPVEAQRPMPWPVLDRVVTEAKTLWGAPLVVFTGGEPLAYRSEGRGVIDIIEGHPEQLFLIFTNGTLLDETAAARLGRAGNATLAFSLEGMRASTDERRGPGTFDRVRKAMALTREAGFPFGVSLTATSSNCDELLSDEFLDFCFSDQGAFYGFLFMYMPMGCGADVRMMPSPRQRLRMWRRTWDAIVRRQVFLFDFWNHASLVHGCLAAGRPGGYLHIDWNGKVMPCVFAPYAGAEITEIYRAGGDLNDAWRAPFFESLRGWQRDHDLNDASRYSDWLRSCPVRDHYADFKSRVIDSLAEPQDDGARAVLDDDDYTAAMVDHGRDLAVMSGDLCSHVYRLR